MPIGGSSAKVIGDRMAVFLAQNKNPSCRISRLIAYFHNTT
jgi:hypothetical protein